MYVTLYCITCLYDLFFWSNLFCKHVSVDSHVVYSNQAGMQQSTSTSIINTYNIGANGPRFAGTVPVLERCPLSPLWEYWSVLLLV